MATYKLDQTAAPVAEETPSSSTKKVRFNELTQHHEYYKSTPTSRIVKIKLPKPRRSMTEPRSRAARRKGELTFGNEIEDMLYAFGDDSEPLFETMRVLDTIIVDFIIQTCHDAAAVANYSGRQKVKADDFKFAIRKSPAMVGRVMDLLNKDVELKDARKQFDVGEGKVGLERGGKKKERKGEAVEEEKE